MPLGPAQQRGGQLGRADDVLGDLVDQAELVDEPRVDPGGLVHLVGGRAGADRVHHHAQPTVVRCARLGQQPGLVELDVPVAPVERRVLALQRPQRLLQRLGEVAADRHRLADRLHVRGQRRVGARELLEREPRHLHHDVVERRLERRGRALPVGPDGDVVGDLVEGVADRDLGRDLRDREAGGLRRQRARARDPRVHLDDDDPAVVGVDGELDVAAAGVDADRADDADREVAQVLVLAVGQRHRRRDGDRVAGVHAHRVEVLDRADDDDVVGPVAHHLELVLLPAEDRLLHEHLGGRRRRQPGAGDLAQVGLVVGHARAGAAHRERRPHDDRVAELLGRGHALVHRVRDPRVGDLAAQLLDDPLERLAVLAALDRLDRGADQLDVVLLEDAVGVQRHRRVERGLAAQRGQQRRRGRSFVDHLRRRTPA